ncbi:MAG: hypothetical protein ABL895_15885 [Cyclobacteriaceae bacterium]
MKTSLNLKENPFVLLLFTTIILLFVLSLQLISNVDFADKVMFGIPLNNMVWTFPFFLISFWIAYLITKKYLFSKTAIWLHVLTTVVSTLLIVAILYIGINPTQKVAANYELVGNAIQLVTLLFIAGQFIYMANIVLGLIKRKKTQQMS